MMDNSFLALLSLVILIATLLIGIRLRVHIGTLAIIVAFLLGFFVIGSNGKPMSSGNSVAALADLVDWSVWLQIIGGSMLASIGRMDGTLDKLSKAFCSLLRGNRKIYYFAITVFTTLTSCFGLSGAGFLHAVLPILASISLQQDIPFVLLAAAYHCRNGYASLSYINTPMILQRLMEESGIAYQRQGVILHFTKVGFIVSTLNILILFVLFGGLKLKPIPKEQMVKAEPLTRDQWITVFGMVAFAFMCIVMGWAPGPCALIVCLVLCLIKKIPLEDLYKRVPWHTLMLLGGTMMLVGVVRQAGGVDYLVHMIQGLIGSNRWAVTPILMVAAGLLSLVSSNNSVVMPTFIPIAAKLAPLYDLSAEGLASAITFGGYATGITPLSVTGSQYISYYASAGASEEQQRVLYRQLFQLGFAVLALQAFWGALGVFQLFSIR